MTQALNGREAQVHIRFEGRSWRVAARDIHVRVGADSEAVKRAVAGYLDVDPARLAEYVVERTGDENLIVRPHAVFG
jgi:hypothetical protein